MTPTKAIETTVTEKFEILNIATVAESSTNPRRTFAEKPMAELTASVAATGVIAPILVRPHPKPSNGIVHELVAGARRYRASLTAKLKTIPAMIRELTDEQVLVFQNIENLQREDVHPLEEADGYQVLLKIPGYTAEIIAEKIGHPVAYVYRRLSLTTLIHELREVFLSDPEFTIGHAHELAALPPDSQRLVFKEFLYVEARSEYNRATGAWEKKKAYITRLIELRQAIRSEVCLDLAAVTWDKNDPFEIIDGKKKKTLGACNTCLKRSGANRMLFEDLPAKADMCLDNICFNHKREHFLVQITAAKKAEGVTLVHISASYNPEDKAAVSNNNWEEVAGKAKKCDSLVEGLFVDGPRKGQITNVCSTLTCKVHFPHHSTSSSSRSDGSKKSFWEQRAETLEVRIRLEQRRAIVGAILDKPLKWTVPHEHLQITAIAMLPYSTQSELLIALGLPGVPLDKISGSEALNILKTWIGAPKGSDKAAELPRIVVALSLHEHVREFSNMTDQAKKLAAAAVAYGVDHKKVADEKAKAMRDEFNTKRKASEAKKAAREGTAPAKAKAEKTGKSSKAKGKTTANKAATKKGGKK